jgi:saccharopine dehydrogenase-like NADP-dependent oxidoreductase
MKVLLVGVGGVGEAIAIMAKNRPWLEKMVLADYDLKRVKDVAKKLNAPKKFPVEQVDASKKGAIVNLAKKHKVDLIMNALDPQFVNNVFDAAFQVGCIYIDMAMSLSRPHPKNPFKESGVKLGDYQFAQSSKWEKKKLLALCGMGIDPGVSDIFARYADKHLFDEIDEIGIRDGSNLVVKGYGFAPAFSIWTTIEECLNPPVIWEKKKGWYTTEPFSGAEVFDFPDGIGPVECVNVEHEEVLLIPRWIKCKRVTFKYGLGNEFIEVLKTLKKLGLSSTNPLTVKGVRVSPRDVVAASLPNPATMGHLMTGKTCAGTWVTGKKDGKPREVFIYQVTDNKMSMKKYGAQAVVWQTGVSPVIAMELLAEGVWTGKGVIGAEALDPDPFMAKMKDFDFPYGIKDMTPAGL